VVRHKPDGAAISTQAGLRTPELALCEAMESGFVRNAGKAFQAAIWQVLEAQN
jgi:hypothetical protein